MGGDARQLLSDDDFGLLFHFAASDDQTALYFVLPIFAKTE